MAIGGPTDGWVKITRPLAIAPLAGAGLTSTISWPGDLHFWDGRARWASRGRRILRPELLGAGHAGGQDGLRDRPVPIQRRRRHRRQRIQCDWPASSGDEDHALLVDAGGAVHQARPGAGSQHGLPRTQISERSGTEHSQSRQRHAGLHGWTLVPILSTHLVRYYGTN